MRLAAIYMSLILCTALTLFAVYRLPTISKRATQFEKLNIALIIVCNATVVIVDLFAILFGHAK